MQQPLAILTPLYGLLNRGLVVRRAILLLYQFLARLNAPVGRTAAPKTAVRQCQHINTVYGQFNCVCWRFIADCGWRWKGVPCREKGDDGKGRAKNNGSRRIGMVSRTRWFGVFRLTVVVGLW